MPLFQPGTSGGFHGCTLAIIAKGARQIDSYKALDELTAIRGRELSSKRTERTNSASFARRSLMFFFFASMTVDQ